VVDAQGGRLSVDIDDFVASGRPELDWTVALPEAICDGVPAAAEVTVRSRGRERSVTCAR
jgi:hypothetical protein